MSTEPTTLRMEIEVALDATVDQVWEAIGTAEGISSWFLPTDLDPRVGGRVAFHMGDDMSSEGEITAYEPGVRIAYAEPDWPELAGHEKSGQTPMISEFLIEARAGGTCVLRVVTSAFGTGADWEQEFWDDMVVHWAPSFDTLARYVRTYAGETTSPLELSASFDGQADAAWAGVVRDVGSTVGDEVAVAGIEGVVVRAGDRPREVLVEASRPRGLIALTAIEGGGDAIVLLRAHLFGDEARAEGERLAASWQAWLDGLVAPVG